jgi:hypothetical protein
LTYSRWASKLHRMANSESVERREYHGSVIEVELCRCEGGFHAWPYIERSHTNGKSKRHFVLDVELFATESEALQAAIAEGQKRIDQGFDREEQG